MYAAVGYEGASYLRARTSTRSPGSFLAYSSSAPQARPLSFLKVFCLRVEGFPYRG